MQFVPTPSAISFSRVAILLALGSTLPALLACGPREPGPHEAEYGQVFYWLATGSDVLASDECTDNESFRNDLTPLELEENSFLVYRLSGDGRSAVTQSCTTTDAATCADSDVDIVFEVSGNELVSDPPAEVRDLEGSSCDLEGDEVWTVLDEGETMQFTVDVEYHLVGDPLACADLENQVEANAPNGEGLNGCVVTLSVDGEFHSAQTP